MFASAMSSSRSGPREHHSARRCAAISASSPMASTSGLMAAPRSARSYVRRPLRHLVERGMPVDLVGGRVEEGVLLLRAAGGDLRGRHHPDGDPLLATGVDVTGV